MKFNNVTAMATSRSVALGSGIFMSFVLVIGIILNGFVLVVFTKCKKLLTAYNINIIFLIINNLCLCVFGFVMPIIAEFSGHFLTHMNMEMCIAEAFIVYLFGLASIYILVAVALTRYMVVTNKSKRVTKKSSLLIVFTCEGIAVIFAVAPLLGFGQYGLEAHGTGCGLDWRYSSDSDVIYLTTITILCFFLPITIITFCYQRIYTKVSSSCSRIRRLDRNHDGRPFSREIKLMQISAAIFVGFLVAWTPYVLVSFYVVLGNPKNLDPFLSRSASLLAKSQVIWNTVLYVFTAGDFREQMKSVFTSQRNDAAVTSLRSRTDIEPNQQERALNSFEVVLYETTV